VGIYGRDWRHSMLAITTAKRALRSERFPNASSMTILGLLCMSLVCPFMSGCSNNPEVVWSKKVLSPGGQFEARSDTYEQSGPGIADRWTTISVRQAPNGINTIEVLEVDESYVQSTQESRIKMVWQTPTVLRISGINGQIDFQAIKCFGKLSIEVI